MNILYLLWSARFIDVSRYLSRDSYRHTVCKNCDTRDLATFWRFLFEHHTNITACSSSQRQSAKTYQLMSHVLSSVIVFLASDSHGPGPDKLNWPLKRSHFPMHDQTPRVVQGPDSIHSSQRSYGLIVRD